LAQPRHGDEQGHREIAEFRAGEFVADIAAEAEQVSATAGPILEEQRPEILDQAPFHGVATDVFVGVEVGKVRLDCLVRDQ